MSKKSLTFIDLFAGIGGFHLAFESVGAKCVLACEINKHARATYAANFKDLPADRFEPDITKIDTSTMPDFDILCAGFPCQPFSQAGYKRGFQEARENRGNMFYEIVRLLQDKKPKAFFLENVRHLMNHDEGRTFAVIKKTLEDLGYSFYHQVVKASDHGLPQHRPRLFMVGFRKDIFKTKEPFLFPEKEPLKLTVSDIFGGKCDKKVGYTLRVGGRSSGIDDRRNWDAYRIDGKVRRLTQVEGKKMMGFPDKYVFPVSERQAMKQLGNAVAVNAIRATAEKIKEYIDRNG